MNTRMRQPEDLEDAAAGVLGSELGQTTMGGDRQEGLVRRLAGSGFSLFLATFTNAWSALFSLVAWGEHLAALATGALLGGTQARQGRGLGRAGGRPRQGANCSGNRNPAA